MRTSPGRQGGGEACNTEDAGSCRSREGASGAGAARLAAELAGGSPAGAILSLAP